MGFIGGFTTKLHDFPELGSCPHDNKGCWSEFITGGMSFLLPNQQRQSIVI